VRAWISFLSAIVTIEVSAGIARADESRLPEQVVVTATRIPEEIGRLPVDITVVDGSELSARDAWDLAGVLRGVAGSEAPPGGDAGPSSAVPSFWGLHEFDAFLLVVDDVPWGGAFNPAITTLDLTDVERVEVLKGAAPVMYGATSFVGVVHVIHYPAGTAANVADIAYGRFASVRGSASLALPEWGNLSHSIAIDGQGLGYSDKREAVRDGQFLYRGALDFGSDRLSLDATVSLVHDAPPSPVIRVGNALTTQTPMDANFNPADARITQNLYHLSLDYSRATQWGEWDTRLSFAHSDIVDIRAFLHPDLSGAADTQNQNRFIDDGYFDSHLVTHPMSDTTLVAGMDLLYGLGRQTTRNGNGAYTVPLDGSGLPPSTTVLPVNEIGTVDDHRLFAGQFAQLDWSPDDTWDVLAGVRVNETYEHKFSTDVIASPAQSLAQSSTRNLVRASGTVGVSYRAWSDGTDEAVLYADYRNAFKPAAIDFGPDYTPDILSPEMAQSYEVGLKGTLVQNRLSYQAALFLEDFQNLVVATPSGALANAGSEQLEGSEIDAQFALTDSLSLAGSFAYHDARFGQYEFFDGTSMTNVAGKQLPLSPRVLASAGIRLLPKEGFQATIDVNWIGRRYLDEVNTAPVSGYATLAATFGYRFTGYALLIEGTNLTDERPPVTASEFGSESFYRLPGRMFWVRLSVPIRAD
jgi:iron complex outermembrane receptor protein